MTCPDGGRPVSEDGHSCGHGGGGVPPVDGSGATGGFALAVFRRLVALEPDRNTCFSPFSIHLALMMALEGARSATQREMGDALHLDPTMKTGPAWIPSLPVPMDSGLGDRL